MHKNSLKSGRMYLLAGVSLALLTPGYAWADEAADGADTATSEQDSNSIVVTATKQDTSIQNATLSVSAVTASSLKENNITEVTGLSGMVPGLIVAKSGGGERMITIRGIGSETPENLNSQPGVSYHVDGVYIFNSIAANAAFVDVAQVEVLRGPQGTTFGQGSTGGTINVVSRTPKLGQFEANGEVGVGNYNLLHAEAGVSVPVGQTFAIRGYIQHNKHDGYATATDVAGYGNYDLDDANDTSWKLMALWEPTDKLSVKLATVQYRSDTHGPAQKNILDPVKDPRILSQDFPGRSVINTELYYGTISYDLDFATLKSITSYQKLHSEQSWDADGLTAPLFLAETYSPLTYGGYTYDHVAMWQSDNESWTQELNLTSNGDGPFKWIVGGVYLWSKNKQYIVEYKGSDDNLVRPVIPATTAWDDPAIQYLTYASLQSVTRKAWAVYAQGDYAFTDKLSLTAGLRYNYDKYEGTSDSISGGTTSYTSGAYLQPSASPGLTTKELTGKLALQYKFDNDHMAYASYTRGFKPGGLNGNATSYNYFGWADGIKPTYEPETVDSFEIGSKNSFARNTVILNASAFFYVYKNMQFLNEDAVLYGKGTSNAPTAHIYGLELEGSWKITDHLRFDGTLARLKGEFVDDGNALDPAKALAAQNAAGYPDWLFWSNFYAASVARAAAAQNLNGNSVPKLPDWQGTASLTWTGDIGPGELTARAQYQYRGQFYYRVFNNPEYDITPSYSLVNLFFKYQFTDSPIYASVSVSNLFDEAGVNSSFSDPYGSAQGFRTYIPPRQAIFSVGFSF